MRRSRRGQAGKEDRSARLIRALSFFVAFCLVFAAGFFLRGNDTVMQRLGLASLSTEASQNPGATISGDVYDSAAARVAEVQGILTMYSLDEFPLDDTSVKMIKSMLASTGDEYVRYYSPEKYQAYRKSDSASTAGVGALFGDFNGQAYVVDLITGGSAQAAGVREGDFVTSINGERHDEGWTVEEAVKAIEAQEGQSVVVSWRRPASVDSTGGPEFTTTLTCKNVPQENVTYTYRKSTKVGYIQLHQLGEDTDTYVSKAVSALKKKGAKAYVLDVRNVAGGYLTQAVDVVSLFQKSGTVVRIKAKDSDTTRSTTGKAVTDAPLVVLVNKNTSGAAEVLASSLQDSSRAKLVGATTMGHGTVQVMRELSFGGAISYTAAKYLTAQGRTFDGTGISPNVKVENAKTQTRVAFEEAASQISD